MKVFKDIVTGDELFTDSCCPVLSECETYYTFNAKLTEAKVGDIDESLIGANASAEEQSEQCEVSVVSGLDFALASKLQKFDYGSKKTFVTAMKEFFKGQKESVPADKHPEFEKNAANFCKILVSKYKDSEYFFGENDDEKKNTFCAAIWNDDGMSATVYVYAGTLKPEKY